MKGFNFLSDEQHQEASGRSYAWWFFAAYSLHLYRVIGTARFACLLGKGWDVSFPKLVCQHLPHRLLSLIPNKSLFHKCCEETSLGTFSGRTEMYVCSVTRTQGKCLRDGTSAFSPSSWPDSQVSTMKRKETLTIKAKQNLTLLSEAKALWRNFVREGSPVTQMKSYCFTLKTEHLDKTGKSVLVISCRMKSIEAPDPGIL